MLVSPHIMNRRGFLQTCLALCAAPAIVRADSLMRVYARPGLGLTFGTTPIAGIIIDHSGVYGEVTYMEVTSLLDTAKQFVNVGCRYSVPEIILASPPGRIIKLLADGRELPFDQTVDGVKIRDLQLAEYGNSTPKFSFDIEA